MKELILFLHIPRTGGTTFRDIVRRQYKQNEILEIKHFDNAIGTIKNIPEEKIQLLKIVIGHFPFGIHQYFPQTCKYITLLRHPISRVISTYNYALSNQNHPHHKEVRKMSITDYIKSEVNIFVDNGQLRIISGVSHSYENPLFGKCDVELVHKAKLNIDKYFLLVGISEKYNQTLLLLKNILGWELPFYSIANISKNKLNNSNQKYLTEIKNINRLDIEFYEEINRDFANKINTFPNFNKELKSFERKNKIIGNLMVYQRFKRLLYRNIKSVLYR